MENLSKIKISPNFILIRLLFVFAAIYCGKSIYYQDENAVGFDFKTSLEIKILLFICLSFLVYSFLQPNIYYDSTNLYIKRIYTTQEIVPLKNIKSLFKNPLTYKAHSTFTIEYIDSDKATNSIRLSIYYYSKKISNFIDKVREINNKVEIV